MCSTSIESNRVIVSSMRGPPVKLIELEAEVHHHLNTLNLHIYVLINIIQSLGISLFNNGLTLQQSNPVTIHQYVDVYRCNLTD